MLLNSLYYRLKPHLPWRLRLALRRPLAKRKRALYHRVWPINEVTARPPEDWTGWPGGKQFAVVLTHDVEGPRGLKRVRPLMELESRLGFRSAFNFIPEGTYRVPVQLRDYLTDHGFEVGVHDLKHDGRLYISRNDFRANAERINSYLTAWNAVGFRSGFMHHNLDWLHDLDIAYDCSTFDTDPFEPQPDGVDTIFPFWVPNPRCGNSTIAAAKDSEFKTLNPARTGYVELPYTLPQDSTLFLLFKEASIDVWKRKVDWIVQHGGMVLLDTHPDYISFDGTARTSSEYPSVLYEEFLRYIESRYAGAYWHALPFEVGNLVSRKVQKKPVSPAASSLHIRHTTPKPRIWIDLDNTPHVPFFEPILEELALRGFAPLVTARDAFQVCELAKKKGLPIRKVGRHHGKNRVLKAMGLMYRALQLAPIVLRERPVLAVSHGARSQLLLSNWFRIPTILIEDYEYSQFPPMMRPTWIMAPSVIPDTALPCKNGQLRKYAGIKEDVYVWKLQADPALRGVLGVRESDLMVTVRPPATEAHYHNPESEKLFEHFMNRVSNSPEVRVVLLPRNHRQGDLIRNRWPGWFENNKTIIPRTPVDGLNLMWNSDLVVSGGGTMNREAAALGVPVYSIFRGTIGAVDRHLSTEGRLVLVQTTRDVDEKIQIVKRQQRPLAEVTSKRTLQKIVDTIEEIAESCARK
jgi:uncharacterized protein